MEADRDGKLGIIIDIIDIIDDNVIFDIRVVPDQRDRIRARYQFDRE